MGRNSHRPDIDETIKPWRRKLTQEDYEIAVGLRCPSCKKFTKKECRCPKK